jgi:hypothetical protein
MPHHLPGYCLHDGAKCQDEPACSPAWMAIWEELLRAGTAVAGRRGWAFRDAKRGGGALVDFPARF